MPNKKKDKMMKTMIFLMIALFLVVPLSYAEVYSNIVGLYKIDCSVGRNLVSMPYLPFNSTLDNVIGNQLT
ncbi:MAG: hypothetical protein JW737_02965, partial [Acidobacteria bacterium]|nr:hypothetical protein [Acidobacteriota bacterium]